MAFNPSPEIAAARNFAHRFCKEQVIIVGIDRLLGTLAVYTYGQNKALCDDAKIVGDAVYAAAYKALERKEVTNGKPN